jgi:hypothetical protein
MPNRVRILTVPARYQRRHPPQRRLQRPGYRAWPFDEGSTPGSDELDRALAGEQPPVRHLEHQGDAITPRQRYVRPHPGDIQRHQDGAQLVPVLQEDLRPGDQQLFWAMQRYRVKDIHPASLALKFTEAEAVAHKCSRRQLTRILTS